MEKFLYTLVDTIAYIHTYIMSLNDAYEYNFSDKELHFIVIGALGLLFVFLIHPIFKLLAKTGHVMVITWIYVFTLIIVITFAIEIGQRITGTGNMEFADIEFGVIGFIFMFAVFAIIRSIFHISVYLIQKSLRRKKKRTHKN